MDKKFLKKDKEELEQFLMFKRKHGIVPSKKGKGSFKRQQKHRQKYY